MNWKKKIAISTGMFTLTTISLHLINKYIKVNVSQNKSLEYISNKINKT